MSCFVVSDETMQHAVTAIMCSDVAVYSTTFAGERRKQISARGADALGARLFALNMRACGEHVEGLAEGWRWRQQCYYPALLARSRLCLYLRAVNCLIYQCSEPATTDDPLLRALREFAADIMAQVIDTLPEYRDAPWDFRTLKAA